jgi:hypothetical protein
VTDKSILWDEEMRIPLLLDIATETGQQAVVRDFHHLGNCLPSLMGNVVLRIEIRTCPPSSFHHSLPYPAQVLQICPQDRKEGGRMAACHA